MLLLLTAPAHINTTDSPFLSTPFQIAIAILSGIVFMLVVVSLLVAKVIKRKRCVQRGSRGTNFAYFVHNYK